MACIYISLAWADFLFLVFLIDVRFSGVVGGI